MFKFFQSRREKTEDNGPPAKPGKGKLKAASPEQTLMEKLRKGNRQAQNMPEDELRDWARSLCVKEQLKEWYLNPDFASTLNIFKKAEQSHLDSMEREKRGGFLQSTASTSESAPNRVADPDDDIDYMFEDLESAAREAKYTVGKKVKVKLVIAEICKSNTQKALRKMLSPVLSKIDHQPQFGMFHSALIIGPWYIEWNNSSLCIPRKCYSNAAMLAADLEGVNKTFDLDVTIDKISDVIIDWNVTREYDQNRNNCQSFIDDICAKLGITMNFEGPLGTYLTALRERGQCELDFPVTAEMRERFGIRETKVRFDTHAQLDDFVNMLVEKAPMFQEDYVHEWSLLKSFDRAFWLRSFKNEADPKFQERACPFDDPTKTCSLKKEWF